ncbi:hypothetical protein RHSIM_Rhsim02G0246400 [Rhododendron simsii]|uniref:NLP1-9 GAF domain-containing protein n=1 Tax=Rhododendron simsii TaxID=118357 RepID=A0A834HCM0_RHOSS|nr:hypothetical protein RHSIM_Rhsim02G0246400 [Rhododendron simsii]
MGMCREYSFYADAESGEDQLGLPGRVFLNQLPEYTALRCKIGPSWAVPLFDYSGHTCIGVLEILSLSQYDEVLSDWHNKPSAGQISDILQDDRSKPEYNSSYADAECGEEQLGLPGRVFRNKLPEHAPDVGLYTLKEHPQRDLALRCEIVLSWALPVFEQSSHTCVGVLEIAYLMIDNYYSWHDKEFLGRMYAIFQDVDENKDLTTAFQELNMVYESVCKIHDLPLALTWVSCRSCDDLLQSQFQFSVLNHCDEEDDDDYSFYLEFSKVFHLRKGHVAGRIRSFPNLLYCSDVKQFHIDEFPLVPFARDCKLGGWFTMCLQSSYTGDELYVLEFFLPKSTENNENILTKLRLILGTMEKNFKTFKFASGQGLGEALSVEVIDFQSGWRSNVAASSTGSAING